MYCYTLAELFSFYRPESAPDRNEFGNIYTNAGHMVMQRMEKIQKTIDAAEK